MLNNISTPTRQVARLGFNFLPNFPAIYGALSYTDDILSIKMMCLLLLLVPDHKTKAATDLLVTFVPVSSLGLEL